MIELLKGKAEDLKGVIAAYIDRIDTYKSNRWALLRKEHEAHLLSFSKMNMTGNEFLFFINVSKYRGLYFGLQRGAAWGFLGGWIVGLLVGWIV